MKKLYILLATVLIMVITGCTSGGGGTLSSAKAITAFSLNGVVGTIDETAKTIAVTMPFGTDVTNLVATFTTTGTRVKVRSTVQRSGTTPNNFTSSVAYTVIAADYSSVTYTVTVTIASGGTIQTSIMSDNDSVAIQSDGKIVVAMSLYNGTITVFAVARYNTDGSLDRTFNSGGSVPGIVTSQLGTNSDSATGVVIDSIGNIVVVGGALFGGTEAFTVLRFTSAGVPDTTFGGGNGYVQTTIPSNTLYAQSVAIDSNGRIVVGGYSSGGYSFALARYTSAGALDTTFGGGNGYVTTQLGTGEGGSKAYSIAIQTINSNDYYVVAGYADASTGGNPADEEFALARYDTSGNLDGTFGNSGIVLTPIGAYNNAYINSIAIDSSNNIVAGGYSYTTSSNVFALARYTSAGVLDTTFGSGIGYVQTAIGTGDSFIYSIAIESNGNIVAGGNSYNGTNNAFTLAVYNTDGSLDTNYGSGGYVQTAIGTGDSFINSIAIQSDGNVVAVGYSYNAPSTEPLSTLARYLSP